MQESPHYQYHHQQHLHHPPPHLKHYWLVGLLVGGVLVVQIADQAYHGLESQLAAASLSKRWLVTSIWPKAS